MQLGVSTCPLVGEMSVESGAEDLDGEPNTARDALAAGEDFVDASCPVLVLQCPGLVPTEITTVHAIAVRDRGKALSCPSFVRVESQGRPQSCALRHVYQGLRSRGCRCGLAGSQQCAPLRIWLGMCSPASTGGQRRRAGCAFRSLAAIWANHLAARMAGLEKCPT